MITRHTIYEIPWIDLVNPTTEEIHAIIDEFSIDETCAIELVKPSDRKSTRLNSSHLKLSRMPSSA